MGSPLRPLTTLGLAVVLLASVSCDNGGGDVETSQPAPTTSTTARTGGDVPLADLDHGGAARGGGDVHGGPQPH